jgi:c-di-GMP-binding flagellar brake protein YcgR
MLRNASTRRFPRAPVELPVHLRVLGDRRRNSVALATVIGAGGCMLVARDSIGFLTLMEVKISLPGRVVSADARVAWEVRRPSGEHHVGVEFLRISPGDRTLISTIVAQTGAAA